MLPSEWIAESQHGSLCAQLDLIDTKQVTAMVATCDKSPKRGVYGYMKVKASQEEPVKYTSRNAMSIVVDRNT